MDQDLIQLFKTLGMDKPEEQALGLSTSSRDPMLAIPSADGTVEYRLKPLNQLYVQNDRSTSIDVENPKDMQLLMQIESTIVDCYHEDPDLTDGQVELALDRLDMSPAGDHSKDYVAEQIQLGLQLLLSLNDYSLEEVRMAIRKIRKSVQRHTKRAGRTGYLDFIQAQLT